MTVKFFWTLVFSYKKLGGRKDMLRSFRAVLKPFTAVLQQNNKLQKYSLEKFLQSAIFHQKWAKIKSKIKN